MANPTGTDFRSAAGARLGGIYNEIVVAYGAVENLGTETYTTGNRDTILANLDTARDAVLAAVIANASGTNP